jgi:CMP-N,N'-diacetyllegionaminic acid synthase
MTDASGPILAIILARGGSRGIPGKNIRMLAGKPLIAYTIEAARACSGIDRTIVSTDDERIAEVAQRCGADVPFLRPAHLAGDDVTDLPVFEHALEWLRSEEAYRPAIVVHLRPTAPLRRAEHIEAGIAQLRATGADSVRSVCRAGQHPHKMWSIAGDRLQPYICGDQAIAEAYNMPRQSLPAAYVQNGSVDVAWRRTLDDLKSMTGQQIAPLVMDPAESVNIDSELDWLLAEILLNQQAGRPV